jgi:hypothetical protein
MDDELRQQLLERLKAIEQRLDALEVDQRVGRTPPALHLEVPA